MNYLKSIINTQKIYEEKLEKKARKGLGVFLTNNVAIIDSVIEIIDFNADNILSKKILEPSCGNGVFIIRVLERLSLKYNDFKIIECFIRNNIFFIDIDEKMVELTKENISKFCLFKFGKIYKGSYNSFVTDFTYRNKEHNNTLETIRCNIDYIIGNPPYISLYGRRDQKKDESQRKYFLDNYSQFPPHLKNGKINYVMLFLEQSLDILKNGGKIGFVIDLAFFETAYKYTRKMLIDRTQVLNIIYNISEFNVASGQLIIHIHNEADVDNFTKIINFETNEHTKIKQKIWDNPNDDYKFRFNMSNDNLQIISKIKRSNHSSLKSLHPKKNLRTCAMLLDMENLFVSKEAAGKNGIVSYPYLQGAKGVSTKYGKIEYDKYFNYDIFLKDKINDEIKIQLAEIGIKNKKRIGFGEVVVYDNPKIFIRQSAKEIIATYSEKPAAANNSLYIFTLRDNSNCSKVFLKYLCGLLNSKLITFYCQQMGIIRFSKGKQPQIKISDLYSIPVPNDLGLHDEIGKLVDFIYNNENCENAKNKIDELIYESFKISNHEREIIEKAIVNF